MLGTHTAVLFRTLQELLRTHAKGTRHLAPIVQPPLLQQFLRPKEISLESHGSLAQESGAARTRQFLGSDDQHLEDYESRPGQARLIYTEVNKIHTFDTGLGRVGRRAESDHKGRKMSNASEHHGISVVQPTCIRHACHHTSKLSVRLLSYPAVVATLTDMRCNIDRPILQLSILNRSVAVLV